LTSTVSKASAVSPTGTLREGLHRAGYIADEDLSIFTLVGGVELQRPLLIEGDAGVGQTALAIALARSFAGARTCSIAMPR
jgi:MoxR-like ATPase